MAKKNTFCANTSEMSDTEKKIMALAMKTGQDQINILRESQAKNQEKTSEEQPSEESEN